MGPIQILFGTESGNAEMVADDIVETLEGRGIASESASMDSFRVGDLDKVKFAVFITSTYGEGELPMTTAPFHDELLDRRPDLVNLRFAAFGLGDSTYETYNNAICILDRTLTDLGATRVAHIGRHDASSGESYTDVAVAWIGDALAAAELG